MEIYSKKLEVVKGETIFYAKILFPVRKRLNYVRENGLYVTLLRITSPCVTLEVTAIQTTLADTT